MEMFFKVVTKVQKEIVSLRGLVMKRLQSMMKHFGEGNEASWGRQEYILRMLYELITDIDAGLVRSEESRKRRRKQTAEGNHRN